MTFTHEMFGTPLPGHKNFVEKYGPDYNETNAHLNGGWGESITAYKDAKGGMVIIYADTVVPEGAQLIKASEFHGFC